MAKVEARAGGGRAAEAGGFMGNPVNGSPGKRKGLLALGCIDLW
jgi:hypothetical protein